MLPGRYFDGNGKSKELETERMFQSYFAKTIILSYEQYQIVTILTKKFIDL